MLIHKHYLMTAYVAKLYYSYKSRNGQHYLCMPDMTLATHTILIMMSMTTFTSDVKGAKHCIEIILSHLIWVVNWQLITIFCS